MLIPTGSLLMTSPTATSSLFFGFATYFFLGGAAFFGGVAFGSAANEYLGARAQVDVDPEEEREGVRTEREYEEASDTLGDAVRWEGTGRPEGRRGGPLVEGVKLVVRWRDENVEPCITGPDIERLEDTLDS